MLTRYEKIKSMSAEQMAKKIIELNVTDKYCKSDCGNTDKVFDAECFPEIELECCIRWLNEEAQKTIAEIAEKYRVGEGIEKIKENERLYKRNMELERMWKNEP